MNPPDSGIIISQWVALVIIGGLTVIAFRQLAYLRGLTVVAANEGLEVGAAAPPLICTTVSGQERAIPTRHVQLLFFANPGCQGCEKAMALLSTRMAHHDPRVLILSMAPTAALQDDSIFGQVPFDVASVTPATFDAFGVRMVPYGVLVDSAGHVRAKGFLSSDSEFEAFDFTALEVEPDSKNGQDSLALAAIGPEPARRSKAGDRR